MHQNNKEQIKLLSNLSDHALVETVKELGKMLNFNPPTFSEGINKALYATNIMEYAEKATAKMSIGEKQQITSDIVTRCEKEIPTLWNQIMSKYKKMFDLFNFKHSKN